ncbi:MAG: hypothetical protein FJY07_13010, partial [Bacteroidetes bacterium]|nr:hypothetical protein [Bacteroidota bacterium]
MITTCFIKYFFRRAKPGFLILISLLLFFCNESMAQEKKEKKKKKEKHFEAKVGLGSFYDDNILKYSDKYLERFMNREDEGRFHIKTYDDMVINPSLSLSYNFTLFGKQKSKINADYSYSSYIVNDIKNWQSFSMGYQQFFYKKASFRLSYNYIPDFYVRHFRDADLVEFLGYIPETFVPYSFSKDNYGIWVQNTFFKNTRIRLLLNYALYFHNEHYAEYNCKNFTYGFDILQKVHKKVNIEASYEYSTSDSKGYDGYQPGEYKGFSDDANADNVEDAFALSCTWQLPKILKLNHELDAGMGYELRYYTTTSFIHTEDGLEMDEEHAGRIDNNMNLAP